MTTSPTETKPVAAQPLYPHTVSTPPGDAQFELLPPDPKVDLAALAALYARSGSAVLYIDRTLSDSDTQALLAQYQLVATFDAVRGVDAVQAA